MSEAVLGSGPRTDWPEANAIVLVVTDGASYREAIVKIAQAALSKAPAGVFVTANRPSHVLRQTFAKAQIPSDAFTYVDCISSLTGIMPPAEEGIVHVESPTMLEKIALRAERVLRSLPHQRKFLMLDSLSTLCVYNGMPAVTEMTHNLVTRLRTVGAGAAFVLVEKQADPELADAVRPLCDRTVRF